MNNAGKPRMDARWRDGMKKDDALVHQIFEATQ